ncbi:hypothetical protein OGATHE_003133 [Ogataea polymorpha]|uniref:Uncharacterized protein n=1 Tax=Ogataea polymorpha TaxID=460523 RepID=A0A9P8T6Z4_9ASCO|nr:hypothetical protein OGATHE_003133 [Ogataea polymorpha]
MFCSACEASSVADDEVRSARFDVRFLLWYKWPERSSLSDEEGEKSLTVLEKDLDNKRAAGEFESVLYPFLCTARDTGDPCFISSEASLAKEAWRRRGEIFSFTVLGDDGRLKGVKSCPLAEDRPRGRVARGTTVAPGVAGADGELSIELEDGAKCSICSFFSLLMTSLFCFSSMARFLKWKEPNSEEPPLSFSLEPLLSLCAVTQPLEKLVLGESSVVEEELDVTGRVFASSVASGLSSSLSSS